MSIVCIIWGTIYVINKKKIQDQGPLPCAKTMAHGKDLNFAVCHVCRHTAKIWPRHRFWLATLFCRGSRVAHGKPFAVCPIYSTRQRPALPTPGYRVRFAVCGIRQRVCRGLLGLCCVPGGVSRSGSLGHFSVKRM